MLCWKERCPLEGKTLLNWGKISYWPNIKCPRKYQRKRKTYWEESWWSIPRRELKSRKFLNIDGCKILIMNNFYSLALKSISWDNSSSTLRVHLNDVEIKHSSPNITWKLRYLSIKIKASALTSWLLSTQKKVRWTLISLIKREDWWRQLEPCNSPGKWDR